MWTPHTHGPQDGQVEGEGPAVSGWSQHTDDGLTVKAKGTYTCAHNIVCNACSNQMHVNLVTPTCSQAKEIRQQ